MAEENEGYKFYKEVLGSPKHVLAPMVDQSELPFRKMSRELGVHLCYTPMWHAGIFSRDPKYRKLVIEHCPDDRPLLFQFCANDPEKFADACELAEPHCDGVDLNLGCPQVIAARGHYGAFLMEEWELVENIIRTACARIKKPITCKIRVYESIEKTVEYAKRLERAGAKIITVHGRRREQRGPLTGIASWDHIKAVKEAVSVPVFANGNIQYLRDVEKCIEYTKVDAVMSAEGALYNPAIFTGRQPPAWEMVDKYLAYCNQYPTNLSYVRGHLFRMWQKCLDNFPELRHPLGKVKKFEDMCKISDTIKEKAKAIADKEIEEGKDSEEIGQLPFWRCQPYVRPPPKTTSGEKRPLEEGGEEAEAKAKLKPPSKRKAIREKHHQHGKGAFPKVPKDKWPLCVTCKNNPWGKKCEHNLCKTCCKDMTAIKVLNCSGHKFKFLFNKLRREKEDEEEAEKQKQKAENAPCQDKYIKAGVNVDENRNGGEKNSDNDAKDLNSIIAT
ncbi:tRNA-dihydrouridine(16/17) synthase [NAD(P)(+)]-like [Clytia hemisphaerica]|uniref:tRNA-dihydrouridine(16/17) synthase [NAD(P)(+)]-like n=1 Tax=Clytia hemisphaerica TaxID=252671 RepID=UPI0034D3F48A